MTTPLQTYLFQTYKGFADRRVKNPDRQSPFRIDHRQAQDKAHDYCSIFLTVTKPEEDTFLLELTHAPHNEDVEALVTSHGGQATPGRWGTTLSIQLRPDDVAFVRQLAKAIRRVVGRGKRYPEKHRNWVWVAPRTADSLVRLADHLKEFQKLRTG